MIFHQFDELDCVLRRKNNEYVYKVRWQINVADNIANVESQLNLFNKIKGNCHQYICYYYWPFLIPLKQVMKDTTER